MAQTRTHYFNKLMENIGVETTYDKLIDKKKLIKENFAWFLNKTAQMFEYENLPGTISQNALERLLQLTGAVVIWKVPEHYKPVGFGPSFEYQSIGEGGINLYAFPMNLSDAPDPYDEPYKAIITSPGFCPTISETVEINKDAIVMRNDTYYQGLYKLHMKYAKLLTEAEISLQSTLVLLRDQMTFIVKNERQRAAVSEYIKSREVGEYSAVLAPELGSPLELIDHQGRSNSVELAVNGVQAIRSAWFNEIGLNPSFSLKREYTSAQEIDSNADLLLPIIDDMLKNREIAVEGINKMFGTNISVKRSSAWKIKEKEVELALKTEEAEAQVSHGVTGDNDEQSNDSVPTDGSISERGDSSS